MQTTLGTPGNHLRVIWACAKKDVRSALTERLYLIVGTFIPLNLLILLSLFVLAGSRAPTAVVMLDNGPYAQQLYDAMNHAHSFSLRHASAAQARQLIETGRIVAVVTIPVDFDTRVAAHQPVALDVQINNLNTDFTNDIRRAVPLSITRFYAQAFPQLVTVVPSEHDFYAQDTDYIPYLTVSILIVALMVGGLLQASTGAAREWENETMKELLLSPASRWAIMTGKLLGALAISLLGAIVMLAVLIFVVGVAPVHWGEVIGFTLLSLVIFLAGGMLLGTLVRQRQPATALTMGIALPLFFLSGAFGPISFSTPVLQVLAHLSPVYYAIVAVQHAFHDFNLNTLSVGMNTLILVGSALLFIGLATLALRRATVAH